MHNSRHHHRGSGYSPVDAVKDAIKKTGWETEAFFTNATIHTRQNGFDVKAAAADFKKFIENPTPICPQIPPAVKTFADWVLTKDKKDIDQRYSGIPPRVTH